MTERTCVPRTSSRSLPLGRWAWKTAIELAAARPSAVGACHLLVTSMRDLHAVPSGTPSPLTRKLVS